MHGSNIVPYLSYTAVVCSNPPEKPRGGKWFWSSTNKNGTFGTMIDYECGPYAKFQTPNTTDFYQKTSSTCQWDKSWTKSKLDPCICNIQSLAKKLAILAFSLIKHPFSRGPGRL